MMTMIPQSFVPTGRWTMNINLKVSCRRISMLQCPIGLQFEKSWLHVVHLLSFTSLLATVLGSTIETWNSGCGRTCEVAWLDQTTLNIRATTLRAQRILCIASRMVEQFQSKVRIKPTNASCVCTLFYHFIKAQTP